MTPLPPRTIWEFGERGHNERENDRRWRNWSIFYVGIFLKEGLEWIWVGRDLTAPLQGFGTNLSKAFWSNWLLEDCWSLLGPSLARHGHSQLWVQRMQESNSDNCYQLSSTGYVRWPNREERPKQSGDSKGFTGGDQLFWVYSRVLSLVARLG